MMGSNPRWELNYHQDASPFKEYFRNERFSDCTVVLPSGDTLCAHRLVLSAYSEFFRAALSGGFTESTTATIPLNFSDHAQILPVVIQSLYEGSIEVTFETAVPILVAAEQLQIAVLKDLLKNHFADKVNHWSALRFLVEASQYAEGNMLYDTFCGIVAPFFHEVSKKEDMFTSLPPEITKTPREMLLSLPPDAFHMLACHPNLAVREESDLYLMVLEFIKQPYDPCLEPDFIMSLFQTVEFADLTSAQLAEAKNCDLVPQELVVEGMLQRLQALETGNRQKKRRFATHCREFPYDPRSNDDKGSILFHLGTEKLTQEYRNPHEIGAVVVSSGRMCYGELASLVGREGMDVWTDDDPNETWYAVDFGQHHRARVSAYMLRRGGGASRARDWVLEASNDKQAEHWDLLCTHDDDRHLETEDDDYGTHTWCLDDFEHEYALALEHEEPEERAYRHFRIRMTKPAHDGDWYFAISGIDFYGHLIEGCRGDAEPPSPTPRSPT